MVTAKEIMSKRTHAEALQTRQSILEAAKRVFADKGFVKSSLSDIAREAKVTRGAIYWHFQNKNEVLMSIINDQVERFKTKDTLIAAANPCEDNPLGKLKLWAQLFFYHHVEHNECAAIVNIFKNIMYSDDGNEIREQLMELMQNTKAMIASALQNAVAHRQLPANLDTELGASFLHSALTGMALNAHNELHTMPLNRLRPLVDLLFVQLPELTQDSPSIVGATLTRFNSMPGLVNPGAHSNTNHSALQATHLAVNPYD